MRIAYLINIYPKVSHTFIRREIAALERRGHAIQRIALRGWSDELIDEEDLCERKKTRYVLCERGTMVFAAAVTLLSTPWSFFRGMRLVTVMGRRSDRPLLVHWVYLIEACVVLRWLKQSGTEHLHAHFGTNPAEVAMLVRALGGPPYSFTVHGPEEFDKPEFIGLRQKVRDAAFVAAVSSFGRSQLYRWTDHQDWIKVHVVHCGLEQAFCVADASEQEAVLPARRRLVCVGRICAQKGQLLLVEAAARLQKRGVEFEVVLAGDGELRKEVEAMISSRGLQRQVRITGWLSSAQVRREMLAASALVLPTFAEGLPVVIMEAMILQRPVISTWVAGIPELVRDGREGWLVAAGSVDELCIAIERFLATSEAALVQMGESAHQRAVERHSIDTEAEKLARLFVVGSTATPMRS